MQDSRFPEQHDDSAQATAKLTLAALPAVRDFVTDQARRLGMRPPALLDAVIAVNEIATNAVTHGQTPAELRMWRDGGDLVVQICDSGTWHHPPSAFDRPADSSPDGRGLWIAGAVARKVTVESGADGTLVTLRFAVT